MNELCLLTSPKFLDKIVDHAPNLYHRLVICDKVSKLKTKFLIKFRLSDETPGKQAKLINLTLKVSPHPERARLTSFACLPGGENLGLYKVQTLELGVRLP